MNPLSHDLPTAAPNRALKACLESVSLRSRLLAFGAHLAISIVVAASVLALVYFGWYPGALRSISGVGGILLLLISVDIVLGPILTFAVFDTRKKSLTFDLTCIAVLQVGALIYGLYTVEAGRPHYLVFVKDRFEVVSLADLTPEERESAPDNTAARVSSFGPRVVAAEMPTSSSERERLLFSAILAGRDIQHYPKMYRDYKSQSRLAASRALPLSNLRASNPEADRVLATVIAEIGIAADRLKFLPVKGPRGDATMLVDGTTGEIAGMTELAPWN